MAETVLLLATLLLRAPLFRGFGEAEFQALGRVLRQRRLGCGETLFREGAPGDSMVIVGSGRLSISVQGGGAPQELGPGDLIGEMSCLDPAPRSSTVTAATDSLLFELTQDLLRQLQRESPAAAVAIVGGILAQLSTRLRETNQKIEAALRQRRGRRDVSAIMPRAPAPPSAAAPAPYKGALDLGPLRTLRSLEERDLEILLSVAPPQRYPDGALLCIEGRPGSTCFLLCQGQVQVIRQVDGTQRVMATLGPGAFVGQMALIDKSARSATVRARGEAIVLALSREDFDRLLTARSPLAIRFQEQVAVAGVRQLRMATVALGALLGPTPLLRQRPEVQRSLSYIQTSLREWDMEPEKH